MYGQSQCTVWKNSLDQWRSEDSGLGEGGSSRVSSGSGARGGGPSKKKSTTQKTQNFHECRATIIVSADRIEARSPGTSTKIFLSTARNFHLWRYSCRTFGLGGGGGWTGFPSPLATPLFYTIEDSCFANLMCHVHQIGFFINTEELAWRPFVGQRWPQQQGEIKSALPAALLCLFHPVGFRRLCTQAGSESPC